MGDLARAQVRAGHDVTVVTLDRDVARINSARLPAKSVEAGVRIVRLPGFGSNRFAVTTRPDRLARLVRGSDAVHLHDLRFHIALVAAISRLARHRTFLHSHGFIFHTAKWRRVKQVVFRGYYAPVLQATQTHVLCSSEADMALLRSVAPAVASRGIVLPNGVELEPFLRVTGVPVGGRIVVIGRVVESKGIDRLLRALALVTEIPWHLALHGAVETRERERLTSIAQALGVESQLQFAREYATADEPHLLASASLAAFPSRGEGFGIGLLDAMASGVPVLASDLPAHRQLLAASSSAIVDFERPELTADRLRGLLRMAPAERDRHCAELRQRARSFDVSNVVARIDEIYSA